MEDFSLENELSIIANQVMDKIVSFGIVAAKLQTPVDLGALRNSIRVNTRIETKKTIKQDIEWGTTQAPNDDGQIVNVNYQSFVAQGTSRQAANPFDVRTLEDIENNLNQLTL